MESNLLTPYAASKIVNAKLGINLPPQMFYNYARQHYIGAVKNAEGKMRIPSDKLQEWLTKYAEKKGLKIVS